MTELWHNTCFSEGGHNSQRVSTLNLPPMTLYSRPSALAKLTRLKTKEGGLGYAGFQCSKHSIKREVDLIHVHQCFQAVGHGTFFTGLVTTCGDGKVPGFSWVYDCGSKRTTRIDSAIGEIERWSSWPKKIDLFVLSHFDDDHVNGVERFLRSRSVRCLALPYMDAAQRLGQAASVGNDPCSASTALFQLDPVLWLSSLGLSEQVDSILFVRGGSRGENDLSVNDGPRPLPDQQQSEEESQRSFEYKTDKQFRLDYLEGDGQSGVPSPRLLLWQHAWPSFAPRFPIELMFFNSEQPNLFRQTTAGDRVARRSGASVETLQAEISTVTCRYELKNLSKRPKRGWRKALRRIYDRHFGHSSQARNNISLCLLVRPLVEVQACSLFHSRDTQSVCPKDTDKAGLLCLGDLCVDGNTIGAMKKHFGHTRWDSLSVVQVPHHGSRHSWTAGNAAAFAPDRFVHCVPDCSGHHPHKDVEKDLRGFNVLRADYWRGVALDYHFCCHCRQKIGAALSR